MTQEINFFLSTPTGMGFFHCFEKAYPAGEKALVYLVKGCSGNGKSTLLNKLCNHLSSQGEMVEKIRCSAQPDALDGIICNSLGFAAFDATNPHAWEPHIPGALEKVISLYPAIEYQRIKQSQSILAALEKQAKQHQKRAICDLAAAACLLQDSKQTMQRTADTVKIKRLAHTLAYKWFRKVPQDTGALSVRLLSSVTPKGVIFLKESIQTLANHIFCIEDKWGACAPYLLEELKRLALEQHLNVICCPSPIDPSHTIAHLIIPSLKIAFVTQDFLHQVDFATHRMIHAKRFICKDAVCLRKNRLRFNEQSAKQFIQQAVVELKYAASFHKQQEECYLPCLNFSILEKECQDALSFLREWKNHYNLQ